MIRPAPLFQPECLAKTIERQHVPSQQQQQPALIVEEAEEDRVPGAVPPSGFVPYSYLAFESTLAVNALLKPCCPSIALVGLGGNG